MVSLSALRQDLARAVKSASKEVAKSSSSGSFGALFEEVGSSGKDLPTCAENGLVEHESTQPAVIRLDGPKQDAFVKKNDILSLVKGLEAEVKKNWKVVSEVGVGRCEPNFTLPTLGLT